MRKEILEKESEAWGRMSNAQRDEKLIQRLPNSDTPSESSAITLLIVVQVLMGAVCIIGGAIMANETYHGGAYYVIGGLVAGLFMFTMAVVTAACRKYLNK